MVIAFLTELAHGFLRMLLNPVFYMTFLLSFVIAYRRVNKERDLFHSRVHDFVTDFYNTFVPGLMAGFILYGVFIGLGFMLPEGIIAVIMFFTFLLSLTFRPSLLSPSLIVFLTALASIFLPEVDTQVPFINTWLSHVDHSFIPYLLLLLSSLLLAEACLILFQAKKRPSPRRVVGSRGRVIGGFETNRVWLVPTFLLIPGVGLERLDWWPLFGWGDSFTFMLVPFLIGFHRFQTFALPEKAIGREGKQVGLLALLSMPLAVFALMYSWSVTAFIGITLLVGLRFFLSYRVSQESNVRPPYFAEQNDGLIILAIIPKTPAAQMNVKIGEIIRRVNGVDVRTSTQFYEALQVNAAYIKLEIIDDNGENRFEQRALYDNEHHELGLLFVDEARDQFDKLEARY